MEQHEMELITRLVPENPELAELWNDHQEYEKQLARFEGKPYLSPSEDAELKLLKKTKLAGKTKIQVILDKHRKSEA
ncbi:MULTISPECIES: DUF465 domain-containing protein [Desulfonatronum]|jgi:uncharacterized protein|uniref:DUF465 domain-containing protein n=1 Tax=Desulfonatronum TaxID=66848 RepID=UPI000491BFDB|nr:MULTISPECIES: DUF465 domain-containing protein [Desulfonatronum]PTN37653.1 DUF465 domain-containing protein [Desulfonatronum sp. SC1]SMP45579.1 hypothetical protein SAMN06295888_103155 [Desulfonatronum zhilinae]